MVVVVVVFLVFRLASGCLAAWPETRATKVRLCDRTSDPGPRYLRLVLTLAFVTMASVVGLWRPTKLIGD